MFKNLYKGNILFGVVIGISIVMLNGFSVFLEIESIITFILIPSIFIIGLYSNFDNLIIPIEYFVLILIFIFGLLSSFINDINIETFFRELSMSVGVLVSALIPLIVNYKKNYYNYFFISFFISFLLIVLLIYLSGNYEPGIEEYSDRSRFLLNANMYSYIGFFGNISLFYLHQLYKNKIMTFTLVIYNLIYVYISFVTASRSGLLFGVLLNFLYWFWIYQVKYNRIINKIVIIALTIFLIYKLSDIYQSSYINQRIEYSLEHGDSRQGLAMESIDIFIMNPIFGVGVGQFIHYSNSGSYSHNSFTEILVNQGIVGLLLLLFIFFYPLNESIKYYKFSQKRLKILKINNLFYLTFILYNFFYPFYKYTYSMMFLFLIISLQKNIIKNYKVYGDEIIK